MIVLSRVEFKDIRIGCCGQSRYDSIGPVGYEANFSAFKKEAYDLMKNYGQKSYESSGDEYSIEYFEGDSIEQNSRENGQSIFKFILEGKKWVFYDHDKSQFSIDSIGKLKETWQL